jgi:glycosyltransferase involved in cell wall biosynthesis
VLSGDAKFETFSRSDIFCFPSHYDAETFGLVLLEAMSFGLPVVATRWRGISSIVREGQTGFLTPIKDSVALADKLEALLLDPELRRSMGAKGREVFERDFTLEICHGNLIRMFTSL